MAAIVPYGSITNTYAHYVCGDEDGTWYEAGNWEYHWNEQWNCPCYYNAETGEMVWTLSQTGAEVRHGVSSWILPADVASPDLMICDAAPAGAEQPDAESWDWQRHWSEQWLCVLYYNGATDGIVFAPDDLGPQPLEDVARELFGAIVPYGPGPAGEDDAASDAYEPAEEPEVLAIADAEEAAGASALAIADAEEVADASTLAIADEETADVSELAIADAEETADTSAPAVADAEETGDTPAWAIADAEAVGDEVVSIESEEAAKEEAMAIADAERAAAAPAPALDVADVAASREAAAEAPASAFADVAATRDEEVPVPVVVAAVKREMPVPLEAEPEFATGDRATSSQSWPDFESEPEAEALAYVPRRTPAKAKSREDYFSEPESPEAETASAQMPRQTPARQTSRQSYFSDQSSPEVSLVSTFPAHDESFDHHASEEEAEVPAEVPESTVAQKPKKTRRKRSRRRQRSAEAAKAEPSAVSEEIVPFQGTAAEEVQWFNEELERQQREYESLQEVVTVLTEKEKVWEVQAEKVSREMEELRVEAEARVEKVSQDMEEIRMQHSSEMAELRAELRRLAEENASLRQGSSTQSPVKSGKVIGTVPRPLVSSSPRPKQRSGSLPRAGTVPLLVSSFSSASSPATEATGRSLDWLSTTPFQSARPLRRRSRGAPA